MQPTWLQWDRRQREGNAGLLVYELRSSPRLAVDSTKTDGTQSDVAVQDPRSTCVLSVTVLGRTGGRLGRIALFYASRWCEL
ncbi:MAG: hypothetical protein QOD10_1631 [Mycobacterium sp.]|nr:hypothetical protein [Mycobacterium sp.]